MTSSDDHRYMAACLRYARRNRGLTGTNPSVGTFLVKDGLLIGKGMTAKGGRPHAERRAVTQAAGDAIHSTAYVSLEPCAHHGATPPCAQALIDAGVDRVVTAWTDPDSRVDGKGHAMLRAAGIDVDSGLLSEIAENDLAGYLSKKVRKTPQVILKLALSSDNLLGREGEEIKITGGVSKNYVHRMRAEVDAIMVGRSTAQCDDPELTCRLPGLEHRSPHRFVLDTNARLSPDSHLAQSARNVPVSVVTCQSSLPNDLATRGVRHFAADTDDTGQLALPEILEDMASVGIATLLVEGGAQLANSFLKANLIDEIALFSSSLVVGPMGIPAPVTEETIPREFRLVRSLTLGDDQLRIYRKT